MYYAVSGCGLPLMLWDYVGLHDKVTCRVLWAFLSDIRPTAESQTDRPTDQPMLLVHFTSQLQNYHLFMITKSSVFRDITPCSPLRANRRFGGKCGLPPASTLVSIIRPWRWRLHVPPKRRLTFKGLHPVISEKTELFISLWEPKILLTSVLFALDGYII
jgi:hypothetical protein